MYYGTEAVMQQPLLGVGEYFTPPPSAMGEYFTPPPSAMGDYYSYPSHPTAIGELAAFTPEQQKWMWALGGGALVAAALTLDMRNKKVSVFTPVVLGAITGFLIFFRPSA